MIYRQKYLNLPYFDHMHRFIPVLFKREQYKVGFFDVSHRKRLGGKSKYGFFDRQIIRLIMFITKGPTDTSKSYEFTDWSKVSDFVSQMDQI